MMLYVSYISMKLEVRGRKIFKENPKPKIPKLYTDVGCKILICAFK